MTIRSLAEADANMVRTISALGMKWRRQSQQLQSEAHAFYFAFKHPRMHWYAKLVALCTAGYLFSPVQLIPSFVPVIGFLDDLVVLFLGVKLLRKITPPDVLTECHELAHAAAMRKREEIRSVSARVASAVAVVFWLLGAVTASALIVKYIPR